MHVLAISGSFRRDSHNTRLLRAVALALPPGVELDLYDGLAALPPYCEDADVDPAPAAVEDLRARISAADALLIATPEYYYSISGALKNAIDWVGRPPLPTPFAGKPVAILGAATSPFATARAQLHLRQVLGHFDVRLLAQPEVYIGNAAEKFDGAGRLTDQATRDAIGALVAALLAWVALLRR
jgi:chromate reductase